VEVLIAGGHGKIAMLLARRLAEAGDGPRALIRNPEHAGDVEGVGATAIVADLEALEAGELASALEGADAIVFAAGAGPGSGPERKWSMDYGGAVKLIEAARASGIDRYIMVSGAGADPDAEDDGGFGTYLRAKGMADADLTRSGLAYTIVRPVGLTDEPGTGLISTDPDSGSKQIPRADVAATIFELLHAPSTAGLNLVLRSGQSPIPEALTALTG
jgi:uncharacterized protein YbjT (DUF2867 family)